MNPFDILKNASQIKQQGEKLQQELAQIRAEGSSGGGTSMTGSPS